jgi:hypothetical protein
MHSLRTGNHSYSFYAVRGTWYDRKQFQVEKGHPIDQKLQRINREIPWFEAHWYYLYILVSVVLSGFVASISFTFGVICFVCFLLSLAAIQWYWSRTIQRVEEIMEGEGTVRCHGRWFGYLDWTIHFTQSQQ